MNKRLIAISGTTLMCVCSATIVGIKIMVRKLDDIFCGITNDSNIEIYITSSKLINLGVYNKICNIIKTSDNRAVIEFEGHVIKCKRII